MRSMSTPAKTIKNLYLNSDRRDEKPQHSSEAWLRWLPRVNLPGNWQALHPKSEAMIEYKLVFRMPHPFILSHSLRQ